MLTFNNKIITRNDKWIAHTFDPYNPLNLPPFTLRVKFKTGYNPIPPNTKFDVLTQISVEPNIWDLTRYDPNWRDVLAANLYLLEVLGANTTGVTNMRNMFGYQSYVGDFSSTVLFDTSSVTDMSFMFYGCDKLTSIPLFDTSNVTNMNNMFTNCFGLTTVPLFNTSKVTSMAVMFHYCDALTSVPLFDTSNVTDMSSMFHGCDSLTSVPLFDTSSVQDMESMFQSCDSLTTVPLFNTSNVTSMNSMLGWCSSLTSVPLFNTSKVTNMSAMLVDCVNVQSGALALYRQVSSQSVPPSKHNRTFENCGSNTTTGAAELAQIPSDWK